MTRRDRAVVLVLVLALGVIGGAVMAPSFAPVTTRAVTPSIAPVVMRPYREGVLGHATQVSPLTAATRADHDLVSLVFSGLVKLGPGNTLEPDLASDWTTDPAGRVWTFHIRADARWQDGLPVTANDVAFTIGILQDPAYTGPGAASWRDVTVRADDDRTVRFDLSSPIGGFLQAATQPIVPEHRLRGIAVSRLARDPFGRSPIGSGPFHLTTLDASHAVLEPATFERSSQPGVRPVPSDSLATARPTPRPERPAPALAGMEFRFFDDAPSLSAAWKAGELDAASGLPAADATALASQPGSRLLRYPSSTLTAVFLNVRKPRPEFRDPRVRLALLKATDRGAIVADAYNGAALRADAPIPPGSWAFDRAASPEVPFDVEAARKDLIAAGWQMADGQLLRPGAKHVAIDLLSPDASTNSATYSAAADIVADWQALGLDVRQVPLSAADLFGRRLRGGDFVAAVVDVNVGLDPDLYPLLASTQVTAGGLNLGGQQDPRLDALLVKARAPGSDDIRKQAYVDLEDYLAKRQYLLPIAFRDELVVARDTLVGPAVRQVGDPSDRYWDVLTWRLAVDR